MGIPLRNHQVQSESARCFSTVFALNTSVKQEQIITKSIIGCILRKVSQKTTMKEAVIFGIFGAIDAMVLPISPKRIALRSCACAQIKALEEGNRWLYPDDYWNL